jgi:hypothetical protein
LHVPVALLWGEYFKKYLSTINTMNMKKILLIATLFSIFGISQTKAQKVVEYRESQARLAEPTMGVYIKPLIAELEINATVGKIKDVWDFTNREVNALAGEVSNLRARALFKSTEKHNADVIVAASFDIASKEDNSGYTVTVIGYPAKYVRWRTATAADNDWIRNEKLSPANSQETTKAITK